MLVLVGALLTRPALGGNAIKPRLDFKDFRVVVNYLSPGEFSKLAAKHSGWIDMSDVRQASRLGFSILKKDATGAMTCEIYLSNDLRPHYVDDEGTLTLGHELLHCMLGDYHR